jgi:hypothetical protein
MNSGSGATVIYDICGRRWAMGAPGFADAIADAFEQRQRPRCLCQRGEDGQGIEMYVARLMDGYIVKRMPNSGSQHASSCLSYEPPAESSGLGQVLGNAIVEDPATGETMLRLDFTLNKMLGCARTPPAGVECHSAASDGTKLSLLGLLHYLWDQAELSRWHPGFAGKRHWATVRRHLLAAAAPMVARGDPLVRRLYLPETFSVEQQDAINARRLAQWTHALAQPGKVNQLKLLIGEVKQLLPARYGFKVVIKHLPDQAFSIRERLFRRMERRFATELALWGADDEIRLVIIATFCVTHAGLPCIENLSLMALTPEWLPISNSYEAHLVRTLVHRRRSFVKTLHYNMQTGTNLASALLTDTHEVVEMFIEADAEGQWNKASDRVPASSVTGVLWTWRPSQESLPRIPDNVSRMPKGCENPSRA